MNELVVISGKGGTGKTSLVASFAALAKPAVLADCDVDAADLHLILAPEIIRHEPFIGGLRARICNDRCTICGKCKKLCRSEAISWVCSENETHKKRYLVDPLACEGCGVCSWFCEQNAIVLEPAVNGEWFISETRFGPMVHAQLGIAESNSGKLVSLIRKKAEQVAQERNLDFVLVDGSPGTGCPVISSITGASLVLIVTEPTLSGLHDLKRVAELTQQLEVPAVVCINKWDLNEEVSERIEKVIKILRMGFVGRIAYDRSFTQAQLERKTLVEYQENQSTHDLKKIWSAVKSRLIDPNNKNLYPIETTENIYI